MFYAVAVVPERDRQRFDRALDYHFDHLQNTGYVTGSLLRETVAGAVIAGDLTSSHAMRVHAPTGASLVVSGHLEATAAELGARLELGVDAFGANELDGEFSAVAVWPQGDDGCTITGFSDPAGSSPLYFGQRGDLVIVSSDPQFVAVTLGWAALSEVGAYELLTYNHCLGTETTIDGVSRIFPGECIEIRVDASGMVHLARRGTNVFRYRHPSVGENEHMTETYSALVDGVRRTGVLARHGATATIGISGGLDSRLTLAAIAEALGTQARAITLDLTDGGEVAIAKEVAETLGFEHTIVALGVGGAETLRCGWMLTGGQVSAHAAAGNLLFYDAVNDAQIGPRLIVGAWPGDCLIGSYVPIARSMVVSRWLSVGVRMWARNRGRQWISSEAGEFHGRRTRAAIRRSRGRLRASVMEGSGTTAAQRISYWAMFRRQPAFSYVSPSVLTTHVLAVTPVISRGYLEHLMELSANDILSKNYYRRLLHSQIPALREVAIATTGAPISTEAKHPRRFLSAFALFAIAPPFMRKWARHGYRRVRSGGVESAESAHWRSVLLGEFGKIREVQLGGLTYDFLSRQGRPGSR